METPRKKAIIPINAKIDGLLFPSILLSFIFPIWKLKWKAFTSFRRKALRDETGRIIGAESLAFMSDVMPELDALIV